jgi:serine/threonine-protein kinase HipA
MRLSDDGKILGIKRFDRTGTSKPLGFEEAATVRFLSHTDKYSGSYEAMVRELLDFISPKYQRDARFNLYKIIAHTLLTGNGDAHQKNFGVLYGDPAHVQLAPAYDLVSTLPYISKDLPAVTFNGRKRWLQRREILAFGEEICGLTNKDAAEQLEILASSVEKQRAQIPVFIDRYPQFKAPLEKLSDVFARQLKKCLN